MTSNCFLKTSACLIGFVVLASGSFSKIASFANAAENFETPNRETAAKLVSAKSVPIRKSLEISKRIDELVSAKLATGDQRINPPSSDEVFVRRIYLDIAGRIPTLDETNSFLRNSSQTKRAKLIDELLDSYGYVSHQFNFWADLLRIQSRQNGNVSGEPYIQFVKDALEKNLPYDEFVRQLITAEGGNMERGKGAVGYYLRDRNMPEDNMSNTIRVFLGTRLECAQCHDHPFDKWTQRQYFEMVAFTGGIEYRIRENQQKFQSLRAASSDLSEGQYKALQRMSQFASHGIVGSGTGLARLPEGYLGSAGEAGEIVTGKTMFSGEPLLDVEVPPPPKVNPKKPPRKVNPNAPIRGAKPIGSRAAYAEWLTDSDTPRFATVIANRLWKQAFGLGLIEPVDVIEDSTVASNPELMDYLSATMVDLNFDMKQFLRAVYNSQTYQASAFVSDVLDPQEFGFSGPIVRRLSAEQIWDSLLVLTTDDIDQRYQPAEVTLPGFPSDYADAYDKISQMDSAQIVKFIAGLAIDKRGQMNKKDDRNSAKLGKLQSERKSLSQQIRAAQRNKNVALERELNIKLAEITSQFRKNAGGRNSRFLRASELSSPSVPGHFLREFGQSDRETIDNSNTDPAVTQVLSMMNGYIEQSICRDNSSKLMQSVMATKTAAECTETIFLSMLNRRPSRSELKIWESEFSSAMRQQDKIKLKDTYSDLIWTLANSNEFIFIK